MTADDPKPCPELDEKLNELESRVSQSPGHSDPQAEQAEIPILDELVNPEDYAEDEGATLDVTGDEKIDDIAERIEQKLSVELDDIVKLLKGNLKDSIMHELHDEIKKDADEDIKD